MSENTAVILTFLIPWAILVFPLKFAASIMGGQRTGLLWCTLALFATRFLYELGSSFDLSGTVAALVLSVIAFSLVLGTNLFRGAGIAVLYIIIYSLTFAGLTHYAGLDLSVYDLPEFKYR